MLIKQNDVTYKPGNMECKYRLNKLYDRYILVEKIYVLNCIISELAIRGEVDRHEIEANRDCNPVHSVCQYCTFENNKHKEWKMSDMCKIITCTWLWFKNLKTKMCIQNRLKSISRANVESKLVRRNEMIDLIVRRRKGKNDSHTNLR